MVIGRYRGSLPLWFFQNLLGYKEIYHFVSTRIGGFSSPPYDSLNLGFHIKDNPETVLKNREQLALTLGIPLSNFTVSKQIHDCNVEVITEDLRGDGAFQATMHEADAMVTDIPDICLMVLQADCVPILFFDSKKKVIGIAHAGWRGTVRFVAQNTVRVLREKYRSSAHDILVGIGPSIGPCCYEVGLEAFEQIKKTFHNGKDCIYHETSDNKAYFDLWEANKVQLVQMGIPEKNIEISRICTCCNHCLFFSYRHQKGETGRFGAGIMLKKNQVNDASGNVVHNHLVFAHMGNKQKHRELSGQRRTQGSPLLNLKFLYANNRL